MRAKTSLRQPQGEDRVPSTASCLESNLTRSSIRPHATHALEVGSCCGCSYTESQLAQP